MKAKLVRESLEFERGGKDHIYTKIGIGERERVLKFLDEIAGDIQFQKDEPEYMGYLNIGEDLFFDVNPQYKEAFQMFIKNWKRYLPDVIKRGLYLVSPPNLEETIFYDEPEPDHGVHAIRESLEFERNQDPKKSMGIGIEKIAQELKWRLGWEWNQERIEENDAKFIKIGDYYVIVWFGGASWGAITNTIDGKYFSTYSSLSKEKAIQNLKRRIRTNSFRLDESLEFERGGDPIQKLGIGQEESKRLILKNTEWDQPPIQDADIIDVFMYKDYPVKIVRKFWEGSKGTLTPEYIGISNKGMSTYGTHRLKWYATEQWARTSIKQKIDEVLKYIQIGKRNQEFNLTHSSTSESMDFERGLSPKAVLGIGQIVNLPKVFFDQDRISGYGTDGTPGTIWRIETTVNRILVKFEHDTIRNLETNKMIAKPKYAQLLADNAGIMNLFQNFYHANKTSHQYYYSLKDEHKGLLPKKMTFYPDGTSEPTKVYESLRFERGKDPKDALGIGQKEVDRLSNIEASQSVIDNYHEIQALTGDSRLIRTIAREVLNGQSLEDAIMEVLELAGWFESSDEQRYIDFLGFIEETCGFILPEAMVDIVDNPQDYLSENINFERGQDPKIAMGIGKAAKAKEIEWDWHPDWDPMMTGHEKFIDLIHYPKPEDPDLYIKVAEIWDIHGGGPIYYAINNIGEPYYADMKYFDSPEEALEDHKKYLDVYFEEESD